MAMLIQTKSQHAPWRWSVSLVLLMALPLTVVAQQKPDIKKCFVSDSAQFTACAEKVVAWCASRKNQKERDACLDEVTAALADFNRGLRDGTAQPDSGWDKEPDSIFGLKFGQRIQDQLPKCDPLKSILEQSMCWKPLHSGSDLPYEIWRTPALGGVVTLQDPINPDSPFEGFGVLFETEQTAEILELFVSRYGEPTRTETNVLQTYAGARLTSNVYKWIGKKVNIVLTERIEKDVTKGSVHVVTDAYLDAKEALRKRNRNAAKDKL